MSVKDNEVRKRAKSGTLARSAEEKHPMLYNAIPDMWHKAPIARDITTLYLSGEAIRDRIVMYKADEQRKGKLSVTDQNKKHRMLELLKKAVKSKAEYAAKVYSLASNPVYGCKLIHRRRHQRMKMKDGKAS